MNPSPLRKLLEPASIAVIGVSRSEDGVGRRVFRNIREGGFAGPALGVNPNVRELDGQAIYPCVTDLPEPVELAIIALPAPAVLGAIEACAKAAIHHAIVLSAGFGEMSGEGAARQAELVERARALGVRILGPNCLGIMRSPIALNASFSRGIGVAGTLALVSQSGAVCSAIVDWAEQRSIGLSSVVSLGAAADVGIGEVLDYLALDAGTSAILLYVEGVDHARAFMSGMRAASRTKPVIVVKAGRHASANRAAASHTGAIVGDDAVFDAALRRTGAVRVATLHELFAASDVLAHSARAQGNRLAVITNAGGLGVLAADRAEDLGVALAKLSDATRAGLHAVLPAHAAQENPIDVLGDAAPERYRAALAACLADDGVDGIVVLLTPQAMTAPDDVATAIALAERGAVKPVLACFMGGALVERARASLIEHDVACFDSPEAAVEAFATLAGFARNQQRLLQLPQATVASAALDVDRARRIVGDALQAGRTTLSQAESFAVLASFDIAHVSSERAPTLAAALAAAERIGYPIALKIDSPDVTHKTDVGGVRLGIATPEALQTAHAELLDSIAKRAPKARVEGVIVQAMLAPRDGREVLVGVSRDEALGPAIACGLGGKLVEVVGGAAIELPPLNPALARELWQRSRAAALLGAFRGMPPADVSGLERVLLRVSDMVCELEQLVELDINPLIVSPERVIALDARIVVKPSTTARYGHLAIAPLPRGMTRSVTLSDGATVTLRALCPEDGELEQRFLQGLSFRTKYLRFLHGVGEPSRRMLSRLTQLDYDRELALLALSDGEAGSDVIGAARYAADADRKGCEFAVVVSDAYQGRGLGHHLLSALMAAARDAGFERMHGAVLAGNERMLELVRRLGFEVRPEPSDHQIVQVERSLR